MKRFLKRSLLIFSLLLFFPVHGQFEEFIADLRELARGEGSIKLSDFPGVSGGPLKSILDKIEIPAPVISPGAGQTTVTIAGDVTILKDTPVRVTLTIAREGSTPAATRRAGEAKTKKAQDERAKEEAAKTDAQKEQEALQAATAGGTAGEAIAETAGQATPGVRERFAAGAQAQKEKREAAALATQQVREAQEKEDVGATGAKVVTKGVTQALGGARGLEDAGVKGIKNKIKDQFKRLSFSVGIGLPEGFKMSNINGALSFLDIFQFTKLAVIYSNATYVDPQWGVRVSSGTNFIANMLFGGPMQQLAKLVPGVNEILLSGTITNDFIGSRFVATIPAEISFGPAIKFTGPRAIIALTAPPSFAIGGNFEIKVPNQSDPLILGGTIGITPTPFKADINAFLDGIWANPLGIPGPRIGNLVFKATYDPAIIGLGAGVYLGGEIGFGDKAIAVIVGGELTTGANIFISGEFKGGLFLEDLVVFAFDVAELGTDVAGVVKNGKVKGFAQKVEKVKKDIKKVLPNIGFNEAKIRISAVDILIGQQFYRQGIELALGVELFGKKFNARGLVDRLSGVELSGYMSELELGPLKITASEKAVDKNLPGSEDEKRGPQFVLVVSPKSITSSRLTLDGHIALDVLGGLSFDILMELSASGARFFNEIILANQFKSLIEFNAELSKPQEWGVNLQMQQEALNNLSNLVGKAAREILEKGEQARKKIRDTRKNFQQDNKKKVDAAKKRVEKELEKIKRLRKRLNDQIRKCQGKSPKEASAAIHDRADKPISEKDLQKALKGFENDGLVKEEIEMIERRMRERMQQQEAERQERREQALAQALVERAAKARKELQKDIDKIDKKIRDINGKEKKKLSRAKSKGDRDKIKLKFATDRAIEEIKKAEKIEKGDIQIQFGATKLENEWEIEEIKERPVTNQYTNKDRDLDVTKVQSEIRVVAKQAEADVKKVDAKYKLEKEEVKIAEKVGKISDVRKREKKAKELKEKLEKKEKKLKRKVRKKEKKVAKVEKKTAKKVAKKTQKAQKKAKKVRKKVRKKAKKTTKKKKKKKKKK